MTIVEHIESLVSSKINLIKTLFSLIKLEARLAGLSIYPLLLNLAMLFVTAITIWFISMALLGSLIQLTWGNIFITLSSVLFLNLLFFLGLIKYLSFNLKNMSFEKTREYFSKKELNNESKKAVNCGNSDNRTEIKNTTK